MAAEKDSLEISQLPPAAVPGPGPGLDHSHDVQNSKLEPHPDSIDPVMPGRSVLLRHQRVLLAPVTPAPATIAATQSSEKSQANGRSPAGSRMSLKMEHIRDVWADLKRRVTPQQYPRAWLLFVAIITIAAGVIIVVLRVAGWCGIAVETMHHLELVNGAMATTIVLPAPPNLEVAKGAAVTSTGKEGDLLSRKPTGFNAEMLVGAVTSGTGGRDVVSDLSTGSTPIYELTAKTAVARDQTTTVYVTVTAPPESTSTTSSEGTGTGTSASSILSHGTAPAASMTTAPITASPTTTTSTSTEEPHIYCPDPERPLIWAPCIDHPTSDASRGVANPFLTACRVLAALWKTATGYRSKKSV
ncbi:hypothetical protein F4813DRAFT_389679 [Daldinia decipiens]|uniref:uncharacterized protein n=1 Tax=Daldinia decipiens TaxID=326647 RepID=UPI0020C453AE|nr:uncharacterized protein F4813DRAFT_389679 [Daldinia decipiens]KAI1657501.1 hypothetical protein F4813DRAFT_389679 [Daldinia decipiens]